MSGSLGPDVIDITSLYKQADMFTFDPGHSLQLAVVSQI